MFYMSPAPTSDVADWPDASFAALYYSIPASLLSPVKHCNPSHTDAPEHCSMHSAILTARFGGCTFISSFWQKTCRSHLTCCSFCTSVANSCLSAKLQMVTVYVLAGTVLDLCHSCCSPSQYYLAKQIGPQIISFTNSSYRIVGICITR